MINKDIKRVLAYFYMPILFAIFGFLILYFGLNPIIKTVQSGLALITSDSATDFTDELKDAFVGTSYDGAFVDASTIEFPYLNTKYAEIECKRIGLSAPVYFGDNDMCLHYGAGQSMISRAPGFGAPTLISGHNSTFFAPMENIELKDLVVITTNYGVYTYEVSKIEIIKASSFDYELLTKDSNMLILYTCYPFSFIGGVGSDRIFAYCDLISGPIVKNISGEA